MERCAKVRMREHRHAGRGGCQLAGGVEISNGNVAELGVQLINEWFKILFYFFQNLNIGLKWPNDIYANGRSKIGGLIVSTQITGNLAVCNVGVGLNLANAKPTVCINDLIREHNAAAGAGAGGPMPLLQYERLLALIFTELERLFDGCQANGVQELYELYDRLWLHRFVFAIIFLFFGYTIYDRFIYMFL